MSYEGSVYNCSEGACELGLGAASVKRFSRKRSPVSGRFRLDNGMSVPLDVEVVDRRDGSIHATERIPPRNTILVEVEPGVRYGIIYTAKFGKDTGSRSRGLSVKAGQMRIVNLNSY